MARYRKLDVWIWNDERFRRLSDDGKLAFIFVLSHPSMTGVGAMRGTLAGLAAELGWREARFRKAIAPALARSPGREPMIELDEAAAYIGLPKFLEYNQPEGPNSAKAWPQAFELIPECAMRSRLAERCLAYLTTRSDDFRRATGADVTDAIRACVRPIPQGIPDAIPDAKGEPCRIQEPKQEPKQEQEPEREASGGTGRVTGAAPPGPRPLPGEPARIRREDLPSSGSLPSEDPPAIAPVLATWNEMARSTGLPQLKPENVDGNAWTSYLREGGTPGELSFAILQIPQQPWLWQEGPGGTPEKPRPVTLRWLMRDRQHVLDVANRQKYGRRSA